MKAKIETWTLSLVMASALVGAPAGAAEDDPTDVIEGLRQNVEALEARISELEQNPSDQPVEPVQAVAASRPTLVPAVYVVDGESEEASAPATQEVGPAQTAESEATPDESDVQENADAVRPPAVYSDPMDLLADKDVGYGSQSSFLSWHGYLNFEFDKKQGTNSNFDNHEFYLATRARVSERVSFTAEFEYEHTPEKLILPIQAYADLTVSKALIFRAGLWFTPMGMPRQYTLRGNKNRLIRQVSLTHDIMFENWSDVGVEILGEFDNGLFYDIGLGNGLSGTIATGDSFFDAIETLQDHTEDNNDNKALHSRGGYHSADFLGGELNAAFSYGRQYYDPDGEKELTFTGGDVRFLHRSGWRLQAEYMARRGDDNEVDLANGVSADAEGWYVQVSKRWVPGKEWLEYVEPVVQVDWIDLNINTDTNGDRLTTAVGLVYSPFQSYLVKFEYDFVKENSGPELDNNIFWAAIVVEF